MSQLSTAQARQSVVFFTLWDSEKRWVIARGLYELNKSFRQIEIETRLPRSSLHRRALAENWEKGKLMPLVWSMVRLEQRMQQLTPIERKYVELEINRLLRMKKIDPDGRNPWLRRLA